MKRFLSGTLAILFAFAPLSGCARQNAVASPYSSSITAYEEALDTAYALNTANAISSFQSNPDSGFRTAGTQAESDAGEYIRQQMEESGLRNVKKLNFSVDIWSFQTGQLSYKAADGTSYFFELAAYQTNLETDKMKYFDLLYTSNTTAEGLSAIKPAGKFILVDSTPQNIRYVAYQAYLLGAAGVITSSSDAEQLKLENYQGSSLAPLLVIKARDAAVLKSAIQSANYVAPVKKKETASYSTDKSITVGIDVSSRVSSGGISSNIIGTVPGVHSDDLLLVTASYDGYFTGFSNSSSVGAMLAMARAIQSSGYTPDKTIVFVAQAADRWGLSENFYNWGQGGYSQIYKLNPEWAGKTTAVIHLEAAGIDMGEQYPLRSSHELSTFVQEVAGDMTAEVYPKGVLVTSPRTARSGDFSYTVAGIPSVGADLSAQSYQAIASTTGDDSKRYSGKAMTFALELYGRLLMRLDQTVIPPLDFAPVLTALKKSLNTEVLKTAGAGTEALLVAIERASAQTALLKNQIWQHNEAYLSALEDQDASSAEQRYQETRRLYSSALTLFLRAQSLLTRVDINGDTVFPHQRAQENIGHLTQTLAAVQKADAGDALNAVVRIDYNRLALSYNDEVFDYFIGLLSKQIKNESKWSLNLIEQTVDLKNVVNSLQKKSGKSVSLAELSTEMIQLQRVLDSQKAALSDSIEVMNIGIGILASEAAAAVGNETLTQNASNASSVPGVSSQG